jgi:chromosome transmission fidelity protein 18
MGTSNDAPQLKPRPGPASPTSGLKRKKVKEVKRDFFGRVVVREEDQDTEEGRRKKRKEEKEERDEEQKVWLSFHEGFSNAVRKGITLEELMSGLV